VCLRIDGEEMQLLFSYRHMAYEITRKENQREAEFEARIQKILVNLDEFLSQSKGKKLIGPGKINFANVKEIFLKAEKSNFRDVDDIASCLSFFSSCINYQIKQ
jgi:hypothetical protein